MLLAVNATPNMKKLICFLYSIPASNSYTESVFSEMKHLFNDYRNRISLNSITAELQIHRKPHCHLRICTNICCLEKN